MVRLYDAGLAFKSGSTHLLAKPKKMGYEVGLSDFSVFVPRLGIAVLNSGVVVVYLRM